MTAADNQTRLVPLDGGAPGFLDWVQKPTGGFVQLGHEVLLPQKHHSAHRSPLPHGAGHA